MEDVCAAPAPKKVLPSLLLHPYTKPKPTDNELHLRKPWKKVLWRKQHYPDNYIDRSFLSGLQRNVNIQVSDFWSLVADSLPISQHLSSVVIFAAVFVAIHRKRLSCGIVGITSNVSAVCAFLLWDLVLSKPCQSRCFLNYAGLIKSCILIVLTLVGLSPILMSLTKSTSEDSVWAIAVWLFLANIFFHEYATDSIQPHVRLHNSLSTNAALSASVVLASRLDRSIDVFFFVLYAVHWFALFPIFRKYIHFYSFYADMLMTLVLIMTAYLSLYLVASVIIAFVFLSSIFFISFVCPIWFIKLQRFKNEIHGPWDIALPKLGPNKD
ncbi:pig-C [Schizosaccharomyces octosporus yFS286]|uniref:Pig-C n=1 Tax=Schizosaccharomyces octosporus (strain yFS286) TaxID=483514 RepID=S9R9Y3_SCHOY|nr:pig-C [Schizosaccharomyces octosporus yFS286]EPX70949.1 pig-C [Schizosaccharomyces octosporus yFS286]